MIIKKPFINYEEMKELADLEDRETILKLFNEFL